MAVDYRKLYAEYYNIEIPDNMDIHHIDEDRTNNDITNLLMLPRDLHLQYHSAKEAYLRVLNANFNYNLTINNQYAISIISIFSEVWSECLKWMLYKENLGMYKWMVQENG